jgi:hypothetical protein
MPLFGRPGVAAAGIERGAGFYIVQGLRALEVCITVPRLESHTVVIRISGGKEPARNSGTPFSGRPRERHSLDPQTEIAMQIHGVVFRNHEGSAG